MNMGKIHIMNNDRKFLCYPRNTIGKVVVFEHHIKKIRHPKVWCKKCVQKYKKRSVRGVV